MMKIEIYLLATLLTFGIPHNSLEFDLNAEPDSITPVEIQVEEIEETVYESVELPSGYDTSFKSYMDYQCITDVSSQQYAMQLTAYTDSNGLRRIGEYYCVAMGSGMCSELGEIYEIEFDSGKTIQVIQADQKADAHTDGTNRFIDLGDGRINIVEFIVSTEYLPDIVKIMGNIDYMPGDDFKGQIVSIRKVVRE